MLKVAQERLMHTKNEQNLLVMQLCIVQNVSSTLISTNLFLAVTLQQSHKSQEVALYFNVNNAM